jgi:hypothetical protein
MTARKLNRYRLRTKSSAPATNKVAQLTTKRKIVATWRQTGTRERPGGLSQQPALQWFRKACQTITYNVDLFVLRCRGGARNQQLARNCLAW